MKYLLIIIWSFCFSSVNADVLKACPEQEISTNLHNCFGSYTWEDGNKYVGEWQLGMMHGQGTYTYPQKYKYVGEWRKAKIDGYGTHTWANGTKYVGGWKHKQPNGKGILTKPDGTITDGVWKNGLLIMFNKRTVYDTSLIPPIPFNLNNLSPSND